MVVGSVTPPDYALTQSDIGSALSTLQCNCICRIIVVYSFVASRRRHCRSHLNHPHRHCYRSLCPSTTLCPCTSPSHRSASVTLQSTLFWLRLATSYKGCLYPFLLLSSTRTLILVNRSALLRSTCPHIIQHEVLQIWDSMLELYIRLLMSFNKRRFIV